MPFGKASSSAAWITLTLGVGLGGCGGSPVLKLGDDCSHGYYAGGPNAHDPCATAGLVCTFHSNPGGNDGVTCQPAFGSVDGGLGRSCKSYEECTPYGLSCDSTKGIDGDTLYVCQPPFVGPCAPSIGCATGYQCARLLGAMDYFGCFESCSLTGGKACAVGTCGPIEDGGYACLY